MRNLIIRTLTGAAYVLLLVGCTVYSPVSAFFFFAVVTAATLWEFGTLMNTRIHISMVRSRTALDGVVFIAGDWRSTIASEQAAKMFALYGLLLIYLLVSELYRRAKTPLRNWVFSFASQLYVALPFALLPLLSIVYDAEAGEYAYNWIYPLSLFIFLWVNDTFAYLCGSMLHRFFPAKLFPRISPKKSWIGSIGGGVATVVASLIVHYWQPDTMPLERWLGFALVVVVFGTWGDLVESLIKRHLGVKDSGKVLPGHGGMLDRFDSALLAIPASVIYFLLT